MTRGNNMFPATVESSILPRGRYAMAALLAFAFAFGTFHIPDALASSGPMVSTNTGTFDPAGNNCVLIQVPGTASGTCPETCTTLGVSVCIDPSTGNFNVTPNDGTHGSTTSTESGSSHDNNTSPPTTTTSGSVNTSNTTTSPQGNTSGTTNAGNTASAMQMAAQNVYLAEVPPNLDAAGNVTGSYTVTVTWTKVVDECTCTYSVTITVTLDAQGNPSGASANGG